MKAQSFEESNTNFNSKNKLELKSNKAEHLLKLYVFPDGSILEKITELDLSNCDLDEVTCSLKNLPLTKLNLSKNNISVIPRCLYLGLEKLQFLDLSTNRLKLFEVEPNCCKVLKVLVLCSNNFKDIPEWIMNHRAINLEELIYDRNKITTLRCIFGITINFSVSKLSLRNCILRDEDCAFLKNCRNLEELDIGNLDDVIQNLNSIRTIDNLFYQPNWPNLSILKMNNLSLSVYPEGLNWLEGLTELHLVNNYLTWLPTEGLEYLVNLAVLNLSHNFIVNLPEKLSWLIHLKVLNLSYNRIEEPYDYSKMISLEVLDLYNNRIDSLEPHFLCENLKYLDVEMNFFDTTEWEVSNYEEMKNKLRTRILEEVRSDGVSQLLVKNISKQMSSDGGDFSSDESLEDWDEELRIRDEITKSDDEWNGEAPFLPYIPINNFEKPSVYNDDVIFCDAD